MGSAELLGVTISAIIAGVFQLAGRRMELGRLGGGAMTAAPSGPTSTPPQQTTTGGTNSPGGINYGRVVRHVGILQLVINLIGLIVGFILGAMGASPEEFIVVMLIVGTILLAAGFSWIALIVEGEIMWKHLTNVALGVAVITVIINAIILQAPLMLGSLVFALVQTFISMGIGGAIASRIKQRSLI